MAGKSRSPIIVHVSIHHDGWLDPTCYEELSQTTQYFVCVDCLIIGLYDLYWDDKVIVRKVESYTKHTHFQFLLGKV